MRASGMRSTRDVVVPCRESAHKVRLRTGPLSFWKSARCPRCGSRVDPHRWRRVIRFLTNVRHPRSTSPIDVAAWVGSLAGLGLALVMAALFLGVADRWWPVTVLLYGPRWTLLLPLVPIAALAALRDPPLLVPAGLAIVVVLGPIMGYRTGWRSLLIRAGERDITVATFNAEGGEGLSETAAELLREWGADVSAFQECGRSLQRQLADLEGWSTHADAGLCVASRFEILETSTMEREVLESVGGSGLVTTYTLSGPEGPFRVTNVHLETPRAGLELIRAGRLREGARLLRQKSLLREIELRRARRWANEAGSPGMVVGDFNTPPESRHYREAWADWTNAFSVAGFGLGGTRLNGWIRARIDHVLVDDHWTVVDAWLGEDVGSDHLPMLARVRLR